MSSSVERFEKLLAKTVADGKLSSSRVDNVRCEAAKAWHHPNAVAEAVHRVHRNASADTKLPSLYLFEALCRFAQETVRKKASGMESKNAVAPKGSKAARGSNEAIVDCAKAFLKAAQDVVEDMLISTGKAVESEQQEKVIKVVDILIKAKTFDVDSLKSLRQRITKVEGSSQDRSNRIDKGTSKEKERCPSPYGMLMDGDNEDEQRQSQARNDQPIASNATPNVPSNILAMLGGGGGGKTNVESITTKVQSGLNSNQMTLLQGLSSLQQQQPKENEAPIQQPQPQSAPMESKAAHLVPPSDVTQLTSRQSNSPITPTSPAIAEFQPDQNVGDLTHFDMTKFDPTSSSSWTLLAKQWYNSYNYVPSNHELINAFTTAMQAQFMMMQQQQQQQQQQP